MAVWVVRGQADGADGEIALEKGVLTINYGLSTDFGGAETKGAVRCLVQQCHPMASPREIGRITGQMWNFKSEIKAGELVVMPRKGQPTFAIGEMAGEYEYHPGDPTGPHARAIKWISKEVPTSSLDQGLKGILTRRKTVTQVHDANADARLRAIAAGTPTEPAPDSPTAGLPSDDEDDDLSPNLEVDANNRIRDYIGSKFHGHEFAHLVAAVLRAQGYAVEVAPPGPDGGVDIVAGSGPMGFDPPRICVQVKSGVQTTNVNVLRELEGIIKNFGADYGLLVSWGGFTGDTEREARKNTYFNVRLWNSEDFLNALFENYDRLPAGLKAELPLKQVWILDEPTL